MTRQATHGPPALGEVRALTHRFFRDAHALPQNARSPATSRWPATAQPNLSPSQAGTTPLAPQTAGTSFLGAQFSDTIGYVPPDSMADVGPSQILVCVNGRIRVFDRSGNRGPLDTTTDNFFASVRSASTSDPHVRYDRLSQRWFVVMIDVLASNNRILLAVSSGPVITGSSSFTFFQFPQASPLPVGDTTLFADYPTLGVDPNALYIGLNMFSGNSFSNTTAFVVRKSGLLSGLLTVTAFRNLAVAGGSGPSTPQGVDNDDPSATEGYFIGVDNITAGLLVLRRVTNPGGTPSISGNINITVPTTGAPLGGVPALGSFRPLDDIDDRLFHARMHHGSLWTAHNFEVDSTGTANASGGRDGSRWYEIINLTATPTLRQSGTVFDSSANRTNYWIPTCANSGQGHAALGCSVAGNGEHAEIAAAGRLVGDALGTMRPPTVVQTSAFTYSLQLATSPQRWGDYSATTVDPNDDMTFWIVQEYCNANNSWGVRVIQLKAPPPATPLVCNPSSVTNGTSNVNVLLSGTSANGSGFFDPGAAYSNRISAAVSGTGLTVNSITYNNPTNLTLNVSIATGAAAGLRTITVTNPDGQFAASPTGILTVTPAPTNNPPVLAAIPAQTIYELTTLRLTNTATDSDGDTLSFSLDPGAPTNAAINALTGVLTWTPDSSDVNTTNSITVRVTDNGSPRLSDAKSFAVVVQPLPSLRTSQAGHFLTISWSTIAGRSYRVQYETNLLQPDWIDLVPDVFGSGSTASVTNSTLSDPQRFYRIRVLP